MKRVLSLGAVAALVLSGLVIGATPALADDLRVTNGNDSGPGSLRDALAQADANPGSEIHIDEGLEIRPISTLISNEAVHIVAEGSGATVFAAEVVTDQTDWRSFSLIHANDSLAVENLTLDMRRNEPLAYGINWHSKQGDFLFKDSHMIGHVNWTGISIDSRDKPASFRVLNSRFTEVKAPIDIYGGASGALEISGNSFTGVQELLQSKGASIQAGQQLRFVDNAVEFSDDPQHEYGGFDLYFDIASSDFTESPVVVSGNSFADLNPNGSPMSMRMAFRNGAALSVPAITLENNTFMRSDLSQSTRPVFTIDGSTFASRGVTRIVNSTFVNPGPAVTIQIVKAPFDTDVVNLEHVTVQGMITAASPHEVTVRNSAFETLKGEEAITVPGDQPIVESGNVVTVATKALPTALVASELQLGDLQDGDLDGSRVTLVRIPSAGSPVINAGKGEVAATDQRGVARPQGSAPDAGAVEVREAVVAIGDAGEVAAGGTARFPVTVLQSGDTEFTVAVTTAGGNAVAGEDYTTTTQTLTFAAGATDPQYFEVPILSGAKTNKATFYAVATVTSGAAALESDSGVATILVKSPPKPEPEVDPNPDGTKKPLPNTGQNAQTTIWLLAGGLLLAGLGLALARRRSAQR